MVIRVPEGEDASPMPTTIAVQAGRFRYPPKGIFNGQPGSKARFLRNAQDADPSGLTLCEPGDVISFYSAGGGGYGDPYERDPETVEKDVALGYVSVDNAREAYGVVIDPVSLKADPERTKGLRTQKGRG